MPYALVVDDDADSRELLAGIVTREGFIVVQADSLKTARVQLSRRTPDLILVDLRLPDGNGISLMRDLQRPLGTDVVLVTGHASIDTAIEGLRLGASDYLMKPIDVDRLVQLLRRQPRAADLKQEIGELRDELRRAGRFGRLLGASAPMQELYDRIARVAPTSAPVLLIGERGSGKTLVARTLHELSRRKRAPFLTLDCSTVPSHSLEAELFGRDASGGAEQRHVGALERAHGGTVLLAQIGALPVAAQVKLLRFLESGHYVAAQATTPVAADVRIVASTERPLATAIHEGLFREDLLQRLSVFPLRVPPLRQRDSDIGLLAQHFLDEINLTEGTHKRFSRAALARLNQHAWPGNVRELQNFVHRAYLHAGSVIDDSDAPPTGAAMEDTDDLITVRIGMPLDEIDRRVTMATLARCGGVKKHAAAMLGISLKTLYNRLESYAARDAAESAQSEETRA
jgi:two-component system, NtrC family, response regulator AtoC